jgi:hypothetical protein
MQRIDLTPSVNGTADHNADAAPAKLNLYSLNAALQKLAVGVSVSRSPSVVPRRTFANADREGRQRRGRAARWSGRPEMVRGGPRWPALGSVQGVVR